MNESDVLNPNFEFILSRYQRFKGQDAARALDFGCGRGQLVATARERGFDFWGADLFDFDLASGRDPASLIVPSAADYVLRMERGDRIPFKRVF